MRDGSIAQARAAAIDQGVGAAAWCVLASSGIAFWFLVGFPFGHHNESYDWVAWISTPDLASVAFRRFFGAGSYRPLAMSLAWAFYRIADGSLVPIQLFNFLLTVLAWWTLCRAAVFRRTFALAALVSGGVFFSGYIYLFHLHGVFYGPMLLWLAWAVRASERELDRRTLALLSAAALVAALAHTFTLVLYMAFVGGTLLERGLRQRPGMLALALATGAVGMAVIMLAAPPGLLRATGPGLLALGTSFRSVEVNRVVTVVSVLFALATVSSTRWPSRGARWAAQAATLLGALVLVRQGLPAVYLWLIAGAVKACLHRRWTLGLMLAASLGLPYAGGSGSPTYLVFALAIATYLIAVDAELPERWLAGLRPAHALAASGLLIVLALGLRGDRDLPVLTAIARPVLAERERTHQAKRLLAMILATKWRRHPVRLAEDARAPTATGGAVDRRQRAPTQQINLDTYLRHERGDPDPGATPIVLSFGTDDVPGRRLLTLRGRHAGDAIASLAGPLSGAAADSTPPLP